MGERILHPLLRADYTNRKNWRSITEHHKLLEQFGRAHLALSTDTSMEAVTNFERAERELNDFRPPNLIGTS